jgi:hypothetical protein
VALPVGVAIAIATLLTLALGFIPGPLFQFATQAAAALLH